MSDPYDDHPLREAWTELKYYTDGVTTARMNHAEHPKTGHNVPCVKVFPRNDATEEQLENIYDKAESIGLQRLQTPFEEPDEHIFVRPEDA